MCTAAFDVEILVEKDAPYTWVILVSHADVFVLVMVPDSIFTPRPEIHSSFDLVT